MFRHEHAGLEISNTEIRLVWIPAAPSGGGQVVTLTEPLPPETIGHGGVQHPAALRSALLNLRRRLAQSRVQVHLACPESALLFRRIRMPKMTPPEVKHTLKLQTAKFLPITEAEACADFTVIPSQDAPDEVSVLVVGVSQNTMLELVQTVRHAGFGVAGILPPVVALGNLLATWDPDATCDRCAVVRVVGGEISAYVYRHGVPMAARTLMASVSEGMTALLELRRSLAADGRMPSRLYILGDVDSAWVEELAGLLNRKTSGSGTQQVAISRPESFPGGVTADDAVAAALSLGSRETGGLNLIRQRLFRRQRSTWLIPGLIIGGAALLLLIYLSWWSVQTLRIHGAIAALRQEISAPLPKPVDTKALQLMQPVITDQQKAVLWTPVLADVLQRAPTGVGVSQTRAETAAQGAQSASNPPASGQPATGVTLSLTGTAPALEPIDQYIRSLRSSPFVASVELRTARLSGTTYAFDMTIRLKQGARQP